MNVLSKPRSLLQYKLDMEQHRLVLKAKEVKPRNYFRVSELGGCDRQIVLDMMGSQPRPSTPKDEMKGDVGRLFHEWAVGFFAQDYQLEGVEGRFTDEAWEALPGLPAQRQDDGSIHAGVGPYEVHFRPDFIVVGLNEGPRWPVEEWVLVDTKSTTSGYGVSQAMKEAPSYGAKGMWGWWPVYVNQVQMYLHLLGLKEAAILQIGREHGELLMDRFEPRQKIAGPGGRYIEVPEWQWQRIPYDPKVVEGAVAQMERVTRHLKDGTIPEPGCPGTGWIYNRCLHNAAEVAGCKSAAQCHGGRGR